VSTIPAAPKTWSAAAPFNASIVLSEPPRRSRAIPGRQAAGPGATLAADGHGTGRKEADVTGNDPDQGYGAAALGLGVTRKLGAFIAGMRFEQLPPTVVHEACRGVLDWHSPKSVR
jgi:hypothetical protein